MNGQQIRYVTQNTLKMEGKWEDLPVTLSECVKESLKELGFDRMTPVQVSITRRRLL